MKFSLNIAPGSSVPIYQQIVDQVRLAVATGKLERGEALPSVRALAEELVINPNTVAKAYAELTRDGLLDSHPGKGFAVAQRRKVFSAEERERRLETALDSLLSEAIALDCSAAELRKTFEARLSSWSNKPKPK